MKNNKRKGRDATPTHTEIVTTIPSNEFSSPIAKINQGSLPWEETQTIMQELLEFYQSTDREEEHISRSTFLLHKLEKMKEENKLKANEIKTEYTDQISKFEQQVKLEREDLYKQEQYLSYLQKEVDDLIAEKERLIRERNESLQRIEEYEKEASEEVEKQDEIEMRMKNTNARMKQEISNYAFLTGIKWNFDSKDSMKGEFVS